MNNHHSRRLSAPKGRRIGLLGGSFNPAHEGHLHISRLAIKHLRLDQVWWLVSPQNPLKPLDGMASLAERMENAKAVAGNSAILVTDIETDLGTRYTADTLAALKKKFPRVNFVWLMGADNLSQINQWRNWTQIFETTPVAIFARPTYSIRAETSVAARRFARYRVSEVGAKRLAGMKPPAWTFLRTPLSDVSATEIRTRQKDRRTVK